MPSATIIIPARLGSTRFPNKVLASATGKPLIQHVFEAASRAKSASRVVIATDSREVVSACAAFGAQAVMTGEHHTSGTSRLEEAARALGLGADEIVVNAQGDEPELDAGLIDAAVAALEASRAPVSTIASPMSAGDDPADPNIVKVVLRGDGCALYFSRAPIPHPRGGLMGAASPYLRHVGLYCYRASFLTTYVSLPETPLERLEKLEQLRVLEHGHSIAVAVRPSSHAGIDTAQQYQAFVERWKKQHAPASGKQGRP